MLSSKVCSKDSAAFDVIAPGTEQNQAEDYEEGSEQSAQYSLFLPQNERQENHDVGIEFNVKSNDTSDVEIRAHRLPDHVFYERLRSLNVKQRKFVTHVLQRIKSQEVFFNVFLTGGAGVGKSVVIRLLYQALDRCLGSHVGDDPDKIRVLLCSPTGKAAYNIQGSTIHSAFRIYPNQGYNQAPIADGPLNILRARYSDLSVVIIDEVSMVERKMLMPINERLKQICKSNQLFGGVSMIFVGDLYQLKGYSSPAVKTSMTMRRNGRLRRKQRRMRFWQPISGAKTLICSK